MYTYELTPNLKTKSYRVLSDGVEVCRSLAKTTAKLMCDTVNNLQTALVEAQTHVKSIPQPTSTKPTQHDDSRPAVTTPHSVDISVRYSDPSAAEAPLQPEGSQYNPDTLQQIRSARQQLAASSEERGRKAEQHGKDAEQSRRKAEQHKRNAEQHAQNAEGYGQLIEQFARLFGNTTHGSDEVSAHPKLPCEFRDQDTGGRNLGESDGQDYRTIEVYPS